LRSPDRLMFVAGALFVDASMVDSVSLIVDSFFGDASGRFPRPAASTSSIRTIHREGTAPRRRTSVVSLRPVSRRLSTYMSNPKTPARAAVKLVLPVPGAPEKR